jgi:hypothetical protein
MLCNYIYNSKESSNSCCNAWYCIRHDSFLKLSWDRQAERSGGC